MSANRKLTDSTTAAEPFSMLPAEGPQTVLTREPAKNGPGSPQDGADQATGGRSPHRGQSGQPAGGVSGRTLTHIADLTPDPHNRRAHNPRNIGMVVDSLHQVGAARSIVIDEDGVILAGNGTIDAAAEAGITRVHVVDADGETIIAVRRTGLSPAQKRALAMFDNRAAELASWDLAQLQADADAGLNLGAFFQPGELADLLGADAPVPAFEPASEDEQGRLDQLEPVTCPHCGGSIAREDLR